jgi:hypothetical protein
MIDRGTGWSVVAVHDVDVRGGGKAGVERKADESAPVDRVDLVAQVTSNVGG